LSDAFVPRVGGILSTDIAVPEHEREVRFYSRVLTTGENPLWREDLMNNLATPIIGLGARSADYAHLPLQWMFLVEFRQQGILIVTGDCPIHAEPVQSGRERAYAWQRRRWEKSMGGAARSE